jgi:hypothetical protein
VKKIPTVYQRDFDGNPRYVTDEVNPECQWVLDGEGVPTRKYDGTCVLIRRDGMAIHAFARREIKPGKTPPQNYVEADYDEVTCTSIGWEPIEQSSWWGAFEDAMEKYTEHLMWLSPPTTPEANMMPGTYELCGPKVNRNPEDYQHHILVSHETAEIAAPDRLGLDPEHLDPRSFVRAAAALGWEGIVWRHPDGRMAKLKARDLP